MTREERVGDGTAPARRALWASSVFYVLIAFEFFYMASPFAAYLYSVYGPGLDWLQANGATSWIIQFFMPHFVEETRSVLIDSHETFGVVLLIAGTLVFVIGAYQIYRAKLRRDDAVTSGLYRHVRHPQYLGLMVASVGMLLIWPRYLVLIATVTVIFVYIALAMAEERICRRQFSGYGDYVERTGRFLPPVRFGIDIGARFGGSRPAVVAGWVLSFTTVLGLSLAAAFGLRVHTMEAMYTHRTDEGVYLSVVEIGDPELSAAAEIARRSPQVHEVLSGREHLLNYVVPTEMYISEIPMHLPPGEKFGHTVPPDRDPARYKVIFTQAVFGGNGLPPEPLLGGDVLWHAVNKVPLVEVHVDLGARDVTAIFPPPAKPYYGGRQVPLF